MDSADWQVLPTFILSFSVIDSSKADEACEFLRVSAKTLADLWQIAREAENDSENTEAMLTKEYHLNETPATVCRAYARADARWVTKKTLEARAFAQLKGLEARREAAKIAISLYQSEVKDRI